MDSLAKDESSMDGCTVWLMKRVPRQRFFFFFLGGRSVLLALWVAVRISAVWRLARPKESLTVGTGHCECARAAGDLPAESLRAKVEWGGCPP